MSRWAADELLCGVQQLVSVEECRQITDLTLFGSAFPNLPADEFLNCDGKPTISRLEQPNKSTNPWDRALRTDPERGNT
ncbi:hypothetical protein I41_49470 [Lacipirellula limnantheis]|uniref:Uncharacterized protein n=1 Tax=Lacipirellula limnantheis TaxID=2528024 RepID=A0A517U4Y9_9BACT|nr:hypothetical protein I41_49470 [Lacipirellula limnantheis]